MPELVDVVSSRDGSFFVIGSKDGLLRVVDTASGNVMATFFHRRQLDPALALSPDGSRLFVGGLGLPGVKVFDPRRDPCGRIAPAQLATLCHGLRRPRRKAPDDQLGGQ